MLHELIEKINRLLALYEAGVPLIWGPARHLEYTDLGHYGQRQYNLFLWNGRELFTHASKEYTKHDDVFGKKPRGNVEVAGRFDDSQNVLSISSLDTSAITPALINMLLRKYPKTKQAFLFGSEFAPSSRLDVQGLSIFHDDGVDADFALQN